MNQEKEPPFKIKSYGWQELATLYNPGVTPRSASRRLREWVKRNPELLQELLQNKWQPGNRLLTPVEVSILVQYLGPP